MNLQTDTETFGQTFVQVRPELLLAAWTAKPGESILLSAAPSIDYPLMEKTPIAVRHIHRWRWAERQVVGNVLQEGHLQVQSLHTVTHKLSINNR